MALGKQLRAQPVRTLAAGSVGASYTAIGVPNDKPDGILQFQNLTDASVMFSFDGVNDHFPLAANSFFVLDVSTNKAVQDGMYLSIGTQFYVKRIGVPSTGSIYISLYYGND